jgi:hypothetical protein
LSSIELSANPGGSGTDVVTDFNAGEGDTQAGVP